MEKNYFYLGTSDDNSFIKVIRIVFGLICIAIAIFWIIYNASYLSNNMTTWVTILFLTFFGLYQIWSGLGHTRIFIETGTESVRLKTNPVLPVKNIASSDIKKIEMFPLSVFIFLKSGRKVKLRFGTTYPDIIDKVKDELIIFAEKNNIPLEITEEQL